MGNAMYVACLGIASHDVRNVIRMKKITWAFVSYAGRLDAQKEIVQLAISSVRGQEEVGLVVMSAGYLLTKCMEHRFKIVTAILIFAATAI